MKTGEFIGILAEEQGISLRQLAIRAGVPYNTLYAIVKRKSVRIEYDTLVKIADALGVTISSLSTGFPSTRKVQDSYSLEEISYIMQDNSLSPSTKIIAMLPYLTAEGQIVATERIQELTEIPKYQRHKNNEPPQPETGHDGE